MDLHLWHLYPANMNIYGDRGNVMVLVERARRRGIGMRVHEAEIGDPFDHALCDLVFAGGGQDNQQSAVAHDLLARGSALRALAEEDVPMLLICGTYQLFGHYFRTAAGDELPGIGLLDCHTVAGRRRMIGDTVVEATIALPLDSPTTLIGFENHSGETYLGAGCRALGRVAIGGGNNGRDGAEGAVYREVHGTYLHGPILPKNPWLADRLLTAGLRRRGVTLPLGAIDDAEEIAAHAAMVNRTRQRGRRATGVV